MGVYDIIYDSKIEQEQYGFVLVEESRDVLWEEVVLNISKSN